ncbi:acetolactate synthase [Verrucomicrobiota bacterium]|nr:acetolactate synthase [Verrucomicrobiota bacterium]
MSTSTNPATSATQAPSSKGELGPTMSGADILVQALEREGVTTIFAYPGGASMAMHQALTRSKIIRTILPRHEQGGVFAAQGYARALGKAGVVMATSGPGAMNLVTGIADAFLDSTPLVAITGQVPQHMIGKGAFQETDVFGVTAQIVKHNYLVTDIRDLPRIVKEAFYIAQTGRPGPVLIDIPKNIQMGSSQPVWPTEVKLRGYNPDVRVGDAELNELIGLIRQSKKPMLYVGGGIISGEAHAELLEFAERTQIPVATTLMGVGCFPETHPLSLKWLGMHGTVYANNAVNEADLLLAFGVRFDDRVTGKIEAFCQHGTIVHLEIDDSEINKNKVVKLPMLGDVKDALTRANALLAKAGYERKKASDYSLHVPWRAQIAEWKKAFPFYYEDTEDAIQPQYVVEQLYRMTKGEAIITTGVGQHQMWAAQFYNFDKPRTLISSLGLGSMGYGYPSAIGAKVACPDKEVIDIDGDGSFVMNIQELACARVEGIAAKALVLNNLHLGMVVQWEDRFFKSNRGHTFLGTFSDEKREVPNMNKIYPDFQKICEGFDIPSKRVAHKKDLAAAMEWFLSQKTACLLEVMVPYSEHVLPMIPAGATYKDIIYKDPEQRQTLTPGTGL